MIPVIDVFAGPGGLGEGFSALSDSRGEQLFKIALSIEKDPVAHQTLRLRSFFRYFPRNRKPREYYRQIKTGKIDWDQLTKKYPEAAKSAEKEVWRAELGIEAYPPEMVDARIRNALNGIQQWVLIGGPPCQVYSQVGRSRIRGESAWHYARDERHLLYKEYLRIIEVHRPPVFIMENVKGLLSSRRRGKRIIEQILTDLREPLKDRSPKLSNRLAYNLYSLAEYRTNHTPSSSPANGNAAEYVIRCEKHGIPQARHRLILLGVRDDINLVPTRLRLEQNEVSMWKAICDLPPLRSRLSRTADSFQGWVNAIRKVLAYKTLTQVSHRDVYNLMKCAASELNHPDTGGQYVKTRSRPLWNKGWFFDEHVGGICNHSTRSHISEDLWRYFYASCFARVRRRSPVLDDFPHFLLPEHINVGHKHSDEELIFADRFRVQLKHRPSTTVTSHISKDGHYFIHPDPTQCRSLTVREAARLQTFPDNYFFMGPRTAQYHQVGNAVPPLLALQIARIVSRLFP
jgi:DNA (cytosine-5)-methyltransferase 1